MRPFNTLQEAEEWMDTHRHPTSAPIGIYLNCAPLWPGQEPARPPVRTLIDWLKKGHPGSGSISRPEPEESETAADFRGPLPQPAEY